MSDFFKKKKEVVYDIHVYITCVVPSVSFCSET